MVTLWCFGSTLFWFLFNFNCCKYWQSLWILWMSFNGLKYHKRIECIWQRHRFSTVSDIASKTMLGDSSSTQIVLKRRINDQLRRWKKVMFSYQPKEMTREFVDCFASTSGFQTFVFVSVQFGASCLIVIVTHVFRWCPRFEWNGLKLRFISLFFRGSCHMFFPFSILLVRSRLYFNIMLPDFIVLVLQLRSLRKPWTQSLLLLHVSLSSPWKTPWMSQRACCKFRS